MSEILRVGALSVGFALASIGAATAQDPDGPTNTIANPPANATKPAADTAKPAVKGWTGAVSPANSPDGITLDANQTKLVEQVSGYFQSIQSLKGQFVQTDAENKRMKGKFFVKRPGRFPFD